MSEDLFDQLSETVQELYFLGEKDARSRPWPDYLALGINAEHIPELIRLVRHTHSIWNDEEFSDDLAFTPLHAWRALGQLQTQEAIDPLIFLVHENEELDIDWIGEEIPQVLSMIGPKSVASLRAYMNMPDKKMWATITITHCLELIGNQYPDSRGECVAIIQQTLEDYPENDETLNAFLISYLVDLNAVEALPLIERVFASGNVDLFVGGDFEDVQIELGVLKERQTPPPKLNWFDQPALDKPKILKTPDDLKPDQSQISGVSNQTSSQKSKKTRRGKRGKRK
jgi:hypothetical protein